MPRVPQAEIDTQLEELEALIADYPGGIGRAAVEVEYARRHGRKISRRTLIRRLGKLGGTGRIVIEGESTARIYRPPQRAPISEAAQPTPVQENSLAVVGTREKVAPESGYIPLSTEGMEVWELMRRPMVEREPVGYDREFLEAYKPGQTWYLPPELRIRLRELGRTPDPERPAGTFAGEILNRLLIDLAWASSRLEGNTYSRLDTQNLIEFGQRAEGTDAAEAQMILNHKAAIEYLVESADAAGFDRATLIALHALLSDNLLPNVRDEGRLRVHPVGITGTAYTPVGIPQVIDECFGLLLAKADAIPDPFEQGFFAMVHLPYLQPFADVNKRTSRLAANIPLIRANLCPLSFVDVPEHAYFDGTLAVYELTRVALLRDVFEWAYTRSCAQYRVVRDAIGQPDPIRLRYREELAEAVRETVRAGRAPRREALRKWGEQRGITASDQGAFAEQALGLLVNLNEGTAGRYRLRPSEFKAWKANFTPHGRG